MANLALIIAFAVIVAFSAILGLIRGLNKSLIRIVTLILAAVLTFVIAGPVTTQIAESIQLEGQTLGEMMLSAIQGNEIVARVLASNPVIGGLITVMPAFVISIAVFPVVFLLLRFVTWIVFLCIQKPLRKAVFKETFNKEDAANVPKGVRIGKRFAGMGIGAVAGVLIFAMILTPVLGVLSILPTADSVDSTLDLMVEQNVLAAEDAAAIQEAYAITDHGILNFYKALGIASAGRAYIDSVSKVELNGQTYCLSGEIDALLSIVQTTMDNGMLQILQAIEDPTALYSLLSDKAFVDSFMQKLFQSEILSAAMPELVAYATESVAVSMNVPANKEAVYNNMMDDIAKTVQSAEIDYAGMKAYEDAHSIVYNFARSGAAAKTASTDSIMTTEEYEAEVQKLDDLTKAISSILNNALSGDNAAFTDSVANMIVAEVKIQASEGDSTVLENYDAAAVQETLAAVQTEDITQGTENAAELLAQLQDQEKFETDVATVETITTSIKESVTNALSDETTAAETATTLANVVSNLAEAVSSATDENGEIDLSALNYQAIADTVTELQNSTLKDVGSSLLDIVVSGDAGKNELVSNVIETVKDGYENGEDISGAINTAGALINISSAMNNNSNNDSGSNDSGSSEASQEQLVNSLTTLINNLDEFTIGLFPSIFSSETLVSMGIPQEHYDATYSLIDTLLHELLKLKGAEDYTNEVNSILSLYNLAKTGVENFTSDEIAELADYASQSDAIYTTLISISSSNPFGIQISGKDARAELISAIEDHYAQSSRSQKELDIHNAIAALLGLDEEVKLG